MDANAKNSNRGRDTRRGVDRDQAEAPVYLRISEKAKQLRELGMSDRAIARA